MGTESVADNPNRKSVELPDRPRVKQALLSPTALLNLSASLLLCVCFFLPHSTSTHGLSTRPVAIAADSLAGHDSSVPLILLWPYLFAMVTATAILTLVFLRPHWQANLLLCLPIGTSIFLAGCLSVLLFNNAGTSRIAMTIVVVIFPAVTLVSARMMWLHWSGESIAAATWGQGLLCVLAAFSLRYFWFEPIGELSWGGVLSIAAASLMLLASLTWNTRARHDFLDRQTPTVPYQMSLREVISAITLAAISLAYWRYLGR